jgi:hypothetical protein
MENNPMTVGELIDNLFKYPSSHKVRLNMSITNNDSPPMPGETHILKPLIGIIQFPNMEDTLDLCSECRCWSYAALK